MTAEFDTTDRLIKASEVQKITSMSPSTIYRKAEAGEFPKAIKLTEKRVVWKESEVRDWVREKLRDAA